MSLWFGAAGEAIDKSESDRGENEGEMDHNLPDHHFLGQIFGVDKGFKQVNGGDADQGRGKFHLQDAGIDMGKPLGLVRMALKIQPGNECFISSNDDHDEKVRDHNHVDQAKHAEHHDRFRINHRGGD